MCAIACGALALPATGLATTSAGSGGSGFSSGGAGTPPPSNSSSGSGQNSSVQSGNVPVSASGDGITVQTTSSGVLRHGLTFTGTAPRSMAGKTIEIDRNGHQTNWTWAPTVTTTVQPDGSFTAVWHANHIGRFAMRAIPVSSAGSAQAAGAAPTLTITVYRPSLATLYGPGFYGQRTACGQRLRRGTIGVASRTLKCGTDVAVIYQGRTMTVPVIDRGPYGTGADWDLTMATGRALGVDGTAMIGAVSLPPR